MNERLDQIFAAVQGIGGAALLLAAVASDGGLALAPTLWRAGTALGALLCGTGGRWLCGESGRALRRRAWQTLARRPERTAQAETPRCA